MGGGPMFSMYKIPTLQSMQERVVDYNTDFLKKNCIVIFLSLSVQGFGKLLALKS